MTGFWGGRREAGGDALMTMGVSWVGHPVSWGCERSAVVCYRKRYPTLPRKVRASRMGHPGCPREQAAGLSTKPKDEAVWLRSR